MDQVEFSDFEYKFIFVMQYLTCSVTHYYLVNWQTSNSH